MPMNLRPYQLEAIASVEQDWAAGHKAVLGTAATGTGKTQIALGLLTKNLAGTRKRGMIISHRQELVFQPICRLNEFWPEWRCLAGAVMGEYNECNRQIISATVQTLSIPRRLDQVLAYGPIDYLVVDECHHSVSATYLEVLDRLQFANREMRVLGITATPLRADNRGLRTVFSKESFHYDIRRMITDGWLVPPRWLAIATGISLEGVQVRDGDFVQTQLADVYETENCFELVVATHKQYAGDRQAMAFTTRVGGAHRLAEAFRRAGIPADSADGTTGKADRTTMLQRFRAGETRVLVNCALWTEGVDLPEISCLHMVRPTRSDALYVQMVGRALRLAPGKEDALILDYCPADVRNICMLGDVLGVDARKDVYLEAADEEEPGAVIGGFTFDGKTKWLRGDPMELVSRQLDYLELSPWSWHKASDHWMSLGLGRGADDIERALVIAPPDHEGNCTLWLVATDRRAGPWPHKEVVVLRSGPFDEISDLAQGWVERYGNAVLVGKENRWRRQPASEAQERLARRLGVWEDGISRGDCAKRITHKLSVRAVQGAMQKVVVA